MKPIEFKIQEQNHKGGELVSVWFRNRVNVLNKWGWGRICVFTDYRVKTVMVVIRIISNLNIKTRS